MKNIAINTTLNPKSLAHAASCFETIRSKSELVWQVLENFCLLTKDKGFSFDSNEEAIEYLYKRGLENSNRKIKSLEI